VVQLESARFDQGKQHRGYVYLLFVPCMQVCTACANAFAHGSNEVANAVGPLAAIYQVSRSPDDHDGDVNDLSS
jgi:phosphate/sulfate permease